MSLLMIHLKKKMAKAKNKRRHNNEKSIKIDRRYNKLMIQYNSHCLEKQIVNEHEDLIILPPIEFQDKPVPAPKPKKLVLDGPIPAPRNIKQVELQSDIDDEKQVPLRRMKVGDIIVSRPDFMRNYYDFFKSLKWLC